MIIDSSYFTYKPLYIPQARNLVPEIGTGAPTDKDNVKAIIDERESELLLSFLGYEQYTDLISRFDATGDFLPDAPQKWIDLVDGKDEWKGLRYKIGDYKKSLIANYVYFYWLAEYYNTVTVFGVQSPEYANSETLIPNDKQTKTWNEFLKMYGYTPVYRNSPTFFNNWNGTGLMWTGNGQNTNFTTLYDFMSKNSDVYDISKFAHYAPINPYNL